MKIFCDDFLRRLLQLPPEQLTPETTSFTPENVLDVKSLVCSFPSRADDIFWLHTRPFYPFDDSQSSAAERSMATGGDGDHIMPRSNFSFFLQDAKSINYFLQAGFPAFRAYVDDRVCHALQEGVPHRLAKMVVKVGHNTHRLYCYCVNKTMCFPGRSKVGGISEICFNASRFFRARPFMSGRSSS